MPGGGGPRPGGSRGGMPGPGMGKGPGLTRCPGKGSRGGIWGSMCWARRPGGGWGSRVRGADRGWRDWEVGIEELGRELS